MTKRHESDQKIEHSKPFLEQILQKSAKPTPFHVPILPRWVGTLPICCYISMETLRGVPHTPARVYFLALPSIGGLWIGGPVAAVWNAVTFCIY